METSSCTVPRDRGASDFSLSRLPGVGGDKPARRQFKQYPIGYFHLDIAQVQVRTAEGKILCLSQSIARARLLSRGL